MDDAEKRAREVVVTAKEITVGNPYYLIERSDRQSCRWWNGNGWTAHAQDAVRFSRSRDAARVIPACPELHGVPLHVTEHLDIGDDHG